MVRFVFRVLFAALGLWLADRLVPGISSDGWITLVVAGLLLGIVNAVVRPVVVVLTFPITLVTLGLFLLVVNAAMLGLVAWFLDGLAIRGLVAGVLGAIVVGVVSLAGQALIGDGKPEK
jgi:putative membrane protein